MVGPESMESPLGGSAKRSVNPMHHKLRVHGPNGQHPPLRRSLPGDAPHRRGDPGVHPTRRRALPQPRHALRHMAPRHETRRVHRRPLRHALGPRPRRRRSHPVSSPGLSRARRNGSHRHQGKRVRDHRSRRRVVLLRWLV